MTFDFAPPSSPVAFRFRGAMAVVTPAPAEFVSVRAEVCKEHEVAMGRWRFLRRQARQERARAIGMFNSHVLTSFSTIATYKVSGYQSMSTCVAFAVLDPSLRPCCSMALSAKSGYARQLATSKCAADLDFYGSIAVS